MSNASFDKFQMQFLTNATHLPHVNCNSLIMAEEQPQEYVANSILCYAMNVFKVYFYDITGI